jgi:gamma-glutamyltranspeptidase/glutathione hydrolase
VSARGAVACGSQLSADAGRAALEAGGNAVDAAVAAHLMSAAVEPGLTGLGGGGLALVRMGGQVLMCDMFGTMPGLGETRARSNLEMERVVIDFGNATQVFHVGPASVTVPGVAMGLWELHRRWGRVPLPELAAPAAAAARQGVQVDAMAARSLNLLWPIFQRFEDLSALYGRVGGPRAAGDTLSCPALGDTLERLALEGPGFLYRGDGARAMLALLGGHSWLSMADLEAYRVRFTRAEAVDFRGGRVWLPGRPSVGGLLVRAMLSLLGEGPPLPGDGGLAEVERLLAVQGQLDRQRGPGFKGGFFEDGFDGRFLAACRAGFTTHLSVVDGEGNAVAITSSLGETAGLIVPETGVVLNNFLGEEDVNPHDVSRPIGERLFTMCCPTLVERPGRVDALGSGGSSRIPTVLLHGLLYRLERGLAPEAAVAAPRVHLEGHTFARLEEHGRPPGVTEALRVQGWTVDPMAPDNLYFGGLHLACSGPEGCSGAGDPRRHGAVALA